MNSGNGFDSAPSVERSDARVAVLLELCDSDLLDLVETDEMRGLLEVFEYAQAFSDPEHFNGTCSICAARLRRAVERLEAVMGGAQGDSPSTAVKDRSAGRGA